VLQCSLIQHLRREDLKSLQSLWQVYRGCRGLRQCRAFNRGAGAAFTSKFAKVGSELTPKGAFSQSSEASKQLKSELAGGRTMKIN